MTTYAKSHALEILIGALALWLLSDGLAKQRRWMLSLSAIALTLAPLARETGLLFALPYAFILYRERVVDKRRLAWIGIPLVLAGVALAFSVVPKILYLSGANSLLFAEASTQLFWSSQHLLITLTIFGIALILYGLYRSWEERSDLCILLLLWSLPAFLYLGSLATTTSCFLIPLLFPLLTLLSYGAWRLPRRQIAATLVVAMVLYQLLLILPVLVYRTQHSGGKELALFIDSTVEDDALILTNDDAVFLEHYAGLESQGWPPDIDRATAATIATTIGNALVSGQPVYTHSKMFEAGGMEDFSKTLKANFIIYDGPSILVEDYHHVEYRLRRFNETVSLIRLPESLNGTLTLTVYP